MADFQGGGFDCVSVDFEFDLVLSAGDPGGEGGAAGVSAIDIDGADSGRAGEGDPHAAVEDSGQEADQEDRQGYYDEI